MALSEPDSTLPISLWLKNRSDLAFSAKAAGDIFQASGIHLGPMLWEKASVGSIKIGLLDYQKLED
jgi:hypothetical protein